jgi:hypothetical protein
MKVLTKGKSHYPLSLNDCRQISILRVLKHSCTVLRYVLFLRFFRMIKIFLTGVRVLEGAINSRSLSSHGQFRNYTDHKQHQHILHIFSLFNHIYNKLHDLFNDIFQFIFQILDSVHQFVRDLKLGVRNIQNCVILGLEKITSEYISPGGLDFTPAHIMVVVPHNGDPENVQSISQINKHNTYLVTSVLFSFSSVIANGLHFLSSKHLASIT